VTEELITETFSRVGQVLNFRLLYDKETGKPKGFGFLEYADADQAASAVRNMNDYELNGRRLRVDFANESDKADKQPQQHTSNTAGQAFEMNGQDGHIATLPQLPPGIDVTPGQTAEEMITKTLSTLPPGQLLDIISQMKGLVQADTTKATDLLKQAPQLAFAIFQALLILRLVDTNVLNTIVQQGASQPPAAQPAPQPPPAAYPYPPQQQYAGGVPTPPVAQQYQPPPQAAPAPTPQAQPSQNDLIQQVLAMPQAMIDALPPEQRAQIMQLRQQFGNQYAR